MTNVIPLIVDFSTPLPQLVLIIRREVSFGQRANADLVLASRLYII
jgi:hypothetical protein